MRWLLVSFVLLAVSSSVFAEADSNSVTKIDAMTTEKARTIRPARNWYAGGAIGLSYLTGWDDAAATNAYPVGYHIDSHPETIFIWDMSKYVYEIISWEGKIYGGYRLLDYLDVEMGYTRNDNWNPTRNYVNYSTGDTIKSERRIHAQALYASVSLRPISEGRGHGLYVKLGGHYSEFKASKTVTGTPANLSTIAAADNLPYDGTFHGYGALYGIGFDFKTGRYGAVRLELSHYTKLGGTPFGKSSLNIGYHGGF